MSNAIAEPIEKRMTRTMLKAKVIVMTMTKSNNIMTELSISIVIAITSSSDLLLKMLKKRTATTMTIIIAKKNMYVMIFVMKIARIETASSTIANYAAIKRSKNT